MPDRKQTGYINSNKASLNIPAYDPAYSFHLAATLNAESKVFTLVVIAALVFSC